MKPVLQALLLAEHVYEDKRTGGKIICGTVNKLLRTKGSPFETSSAPDGKRVKTVRGGGIGCLYVYLSLTEVHDGTELSLQLVDTVDNHVLMHTGINFEKAHPLDTAEAVLTLPPVSFLFADGRHNLSLDVVWNGEILGTHRLVVEDAPEPQGDEHDTDGN